MQNFNGRLTLIALAFIVISGLMIARLLSFQFQLDPDIQQRLYDVAGVTSGQEVEYRPNRGLIYDRDGQVLAVNTLEYRIGISPVALGVNREEKRQVARDLARILDLNEQEVYFSLLPDEVSGQYPRYISLKSPATLEEGAAIEDLDISGIVIEPIYRRDYTEEILMDQLLGFVSLDSVGFWGVEAHYQTELAGQSRIEERAVDPLQISESINIRNGQDLVLTIDSDIQWVAQQVLAEAVERENALGGTIIVMDPETGEILAMVSYPYWTLEEYNELPEDEKPIFNPAIRYMYEPGSIFKIVSAAIALDANVGIDMNWTYFNRGCEEMGGVPICDSGNSPGNSDPLGETSFALCLIRSLNTCTSTWNRDYITRGIWYEYLKAFGFGLPTGVDMNSEVSGIVNLPGSSGFNEANYLQTSFGQGISVTPLQMLVAANAVANEGVIYRPHIVQSFRDGDTVYENRPTSVSRPITAATAQQIMRLLVGAVEDPLGWGGLARVEGYTVAGKTGTAQKIDGFSYSDTDSWASFIGFVPADDPQLSVIIMLDNPEGYWGSQTAAPVFGELVSRLVVLLEIPPDNVRIELISEGAQPYARD
jgi:cell division protein FtsI/penicillin-binding protein 2